jgi:3'-5' exoribonuclease
MADECRFEHLPRGPRVAGRALVVEAAIATTRAPAEAPYLRALLRDRAGRTLAARRWDCADPPPSAGDVVEVTGTIQLYRERLQLNLEALRSLGPGRAADWAREVEMPLAERTGRLAAAIGGIADPALRGLVEAVFGQDGLRPRFLAAPAAKRYHSARVGGLATHSLAVHDTALWLAANLCPAPIDRDVLRAGALLHDVGKADELEIGLASGFEPAHTVEHLQGHVALAVRRVERAAATLPDCPGRRVDHLVHLIVSHHGSREWGAPEVPMTVEATLLHVADFAASRVEGVCDVLRQAPAGAEWTDRSSMLGERLYVGGG